MMEQKKLEFLKQNGVDTDKGIENTMDFETYNEILLEICDSFRVEVNKFKIYKIDNDMVNYEIIVHALKSNCRTLGFTSTGEMFYQHELASKSGDSTWVNENYNALIEEVNRVYKILMTYKGME